MFFFYHFYAEGGDQALVAAFLETVEHLSLEQAGALIDVSHETVSRWRRGDWVRLSSRVRERILDYLEEKTRDHSGDIPAGATEMLLRKEFLEELLREVGPPGAERERKAEVVRVYRELVSLLAPMPLWLRSLKEKITSQD